jgi:sec-independent protein translocase protein TatA
VESPDPSLNSGAAAIPGLEPGVFRAPYTRDMGIGAPELLIVLLVVLVIFGGSQLPKLARGLGSAQREFKKGLDEGAEDDEAPEKSKKSE